MTDMSKHLEEALAKAGEALLRATEDHGFDSYNAALLGRLEVDLSRPGFTMRGQMDIVLPDEMRDPEYSQRLWSRWYGSRKAANRVEGILRSAKGAEPARFLKRLKHQQPLALISLILGSPYAKSLIFPGLSQESIRSIALVNRLPVICQELEAKYGHTIQSDSTGDWDKSSYTLTAKKIEHAWPFMAAIHDHGCFRMYHAKTLLLVDHLCKYLESGEVIPSDIQVVRMAINVALEKVLPRIEALAAIHRPVIGDCFPYQFAFDGITADNFNRGASIWNQVDPAALEETCKQIVLDSRVFALTRSNDSGFSAASEDMAGILVRSQNLGRLLARMYEHACQGPLIADSYESSRVYLAATVEMLELGEAIDLKEVPEDLIGRDIHAENICSVEEALIALVIHREKACKAITEIMRCIQIDTQRTEQVKALDESMKALAQHGGLLKMLKIAAMADEANQLLQDGRAFVLETLYPLMRDYARIWLDFYALIQSLPRKNEAPVSFESSEQQPQPEKQEALPNLVDSAELDTLREELNVTQADNEHLRRDLNELRAAAHRMRSQLANKQESQEENIPLDCTGAITRLVARKDCGPADVLSYYAGTAPDRLTVLPGALAGAQAYQIPYEPTERMIEVMGKLVGPYLDALRSGQPDTLARNVLGGKAYAAKESETTLATPRFRAMREFEYKGEKRLFVQHLRISNEVGAKGMRIYFLVDGDGQDKRIVVAYVGPHMGVPSSN